MAAVARGATGDGDVHPPSRTAPRGSPTPDRHRTTDGPGSTRRRTRENSPRNCTTTLVRDGPRPGCRRGRRDRGGHGAGGERGEHRHLGVVRAGQPHQRQGPRRVRPVHGRRRPDHAVVAPRRHQPAVAVRRLRGRLLPGEVAVVGQGPRRQRTVHGRRRRGHPVDRQQLDEPAVQRPGRRRLHPAHRPPQRQGRRDPGGVHGRRRERRAVRRLERRQPAVAAGPGRRR